MIIRSKSLTLILTILLFNLIGCGGGVTKRTRPAEEHNPDKEGFETAFDFYGKSAEDQIEKARYMVGNSDFDKALATLRNLIKSHPDDELADDAQFLIGGIYSTPLNNNRDKDKAIQAFQKVIDSYPEGGLVERAKQRISELKSLP